MTRTKDDSLDSHLGVNHVSKSQLGVKVYEYYINSLYNNWVASVHIWFCSRVFYTFVRSLAMIICNCSVYNHFNKWSVTKSGIFPHIPLNGTFFCLNKIVCCGYLFQSGVLIYNFSTSNADVTPDFVGQPSFL